MLFVYYFQQIEETYAIFLFVVTLSARVSKTIYYVLSRDGKQ